MHGSMEAFTIHMDKKISIVVPCYNAASTLDRCMESLLRQTIGLEHMEIILVDDASTDEGKTAERLLWYEQQFPEQIMVIMLEENLRQGGARNVGIGYAGGEYLLFCDADDCLSLCAAERLCDMAQQYQADVVEFAIREIQEDEEMEAASPGGQSYLLDMTDEKVRRAVLGLSRKEFGLGCMNKLYRLDLIREKNICFAEHLIYEEPSFTLPVRCYERRHFYLDEALYYYYVQADGTMRGRKREHYLDSMKVWNLLMEDLKQRGILQTYRQELGKMYYHWAFLLNLQILMEKGECITGELFEVMRANVLERFADIRENPLLERTDHWDELAVLEMEYTEERQQELLEMIWERIRRG